MWIAQVRLECWPESLGEPEVLTVGQTQSRQVLRTVADALLAEADGEANEWEGTDGVMAALTAAERERLRRVLGVLLSEPDLRVIADSEEP